MNLYLHQVEPHIGGNDSIYDPPGSERFDVVLTNPPFGTKGANQAPTRDDFVVETSNKQLNFIQHVITILKPGGRAAVVVPDNVLFTEQSGDVFKVLTEDCDLHTVLRLPRGTFSPYSPGTTTNVIFFTKGRPTERVWIYDARINVPGITKKDRPLTSAHFAAFEKCYGADPFGRGKRSTSSSKDDRWREFGIKEVQEHSYNLDGLKWLHDDESDDAGALLEPDALLAEATSELHAALADLAALQTLIAPLSEVDA
jgi:type I restriction enzyme M protein